MNLLEENKILLKQYIRFQKETVFPIINCRKGGKPLRK